jgi:hypothetical protein
MNFRFASQLKKVKIAESFVSALSRIEISFFGKIAYSFGTNLRQAFPR